MSYSQITMRYVDEGGTPESMKIRCCKGSAITVYFSRRVSTGIYAIERQRIDTDEDAFLVLHWLCLQPSPNPKRDAIVLKFRQYFPHAYALILKNQLSGELSRNYAEYLAESSADSSADSSVQRRMPQGPELDAIVAELKRDYPSLYIECLSEGLLSTEGCDVI